MTVSGPPLSRALRHATVRLFYVDISSFSRPVQLVLLSCGVFGAFIIYGCFQGFRPFGWYLTLLQFAVYSVFSRVEMLLQRHDSRRIPLKAYLLLSFYTVATMGLSNAAVGYLNYPTQVIFKCCKLIPVLIGGIIIQGKKFNATDFVAGCLMSAGLVLFTLADNEVSPNFNSKGYVLISLALMADAIIGNVQEKAMKEHGASNLEVIFYSYSIGFLYILVFVICSGEFIEAFNFSAKYPVETYGYAMLFSITGYLGISVVLTLVRTYGAFIAVTVTTCRKAVSIVLSFIFFAKPFTFQYVWSGLIVFAGICLNDFGKHGLVDVLKKLGRHLIYLLHIVSIKVCPMSYAYSAKSRLKSDLTVI